MKRFLALLLVVPIYAQTRIISHVTRPGGGFTTQIILENLSVDASDVSIEAFADNGSSLAIFPFDVAANSTQAVDLSTLTTSSPISHFTILEADDVTISVAYQNDSGPGSPAQVGEGYPLGTRVRLFAGDWSQIFDGIAVVNTGSVATSVWVSQLGLDGSLFASAQISSKLNPNAKALYVIGGPDGSVFDPANGDRFVVSSTQPMAITALRGTVPGAPVGFLWANTIETRGTAESTRDAQGVWFITQGNFYDVFEMMGYNVSSDRLWQTDLFRRSARGTLAEILGEDFLEQDIQARSVGYSESELEDHYSQLGSEARIAIKAYVDGFNRRVSEITAEPSLIPFEYAAIGVEGVEKWSVSDCMAWVAFLQREFDPNDYAIGQMENAAFYQELLAANSTDAGDMFEDFNFINDPDSPTMIPDTSSSKVVTMNPAWQQAEIRRDIDFSAIARNMRDRRTRIHERLESINARVKMGSYAWVVSGSKTLSGNPILYSGPQMGFSAPAITVEGSIRGGGLNISGMTVPGIPGIIIGRTPHHAWSMQVGHAHTSDLYIEPPSSLAGGPHHQETIKVRGGDDVVLDVYRTIHGPVVNQSPIVTWKYAHWGFEFNTIEAFLGLAQATSVSEFGDAVEMIGVSQHYCYADRDGNIAYWMSGRDPVRPNGDYRFPQGTFSTPLEYSNSTRKPLAHDSNPEQGFYAGWNNKAAANYNNAPYGGGLTYGPAHRAESIQTLIETSGTMSYADVRDAAIDIAATDSFGSGGNPWVFVADQFTDAVNADSNSIRNGALNLIHAWDGHFVDGGELRWILGEDRADAWVLTDKWIRHAMRRTFEDELGSFNLIQGFQVFLHGLGDATLTNRIDWFKNADESAPQTAQDIIVAALDDALLELGSQPWGIGTRGSITYMHPLLPSTVWLTPFSSRSTYAHCVEYGPDGPLRIQSMFPLGQSGLITASPQGIPLFSPLFYSMAPFFDNFNMRQFPLFD